MKRFAIWRDWLLALLSVTQGGGELPRAGGVLRVFLHEKLLRGTLVHEAARTAVAAGALHDCQ